jgi:thymidylate kinase
MAVTGISECHQGASLHEKLFSSLNKNKVKYIVYKGLGHLKEDLNGDNGDLDIYVAPNDYQLARNIVKGLNFKHARSTGYSDVFFGIDEATLRYLQIELVSAIPVGGKPFYKKKLIFSFDNDLIKKHAVFKNVMIYKYEVILEDFIRGAYKDSKNGASDIIPGFSSSEYLKKETAAFLYNHSLMYVRCRLNVSQQNRIKGALVVFLGIDGAGKSTISARLSEMPYFKSLSIKRIYFGNNEYWLPGLKKLSRNEYGAVGRLVISGLCAIDRQLRVLKAIYFKSLGCLVIADRFYYDDILTRRSNTVRKNGVAKFILIKFFSPRMLVRPDKVILLDVDPLRSIARKGEHTKEKLEFVRKFYIEYLANKEYCTIIDANQEEQNVLKDVVSELHKC